LTSTMPYLAPGKPGSFDPIKPGSFDPIMVWS